MIEEPNFEIRLLEALESITESLKILAAKPAPGITLEVSPELLDQQEDV